MKRFQFEFEAFNDSHTIDVRNANKNWKLIKGTFSVSMRKMTNEDFCAESYYMNCLEWPLEFLEGAWESAEPISFDPMGFSFLSASYTVSWLCFFSDVCSRLSGLDDWLDLTSFKIKYCLTI